MELSGLIFAFLIKKLEDKWPARGSMVFEAKRMPSLEFVHAHHHHR
jgi:hypothetical protein